MWALIIQTRGSHTWLVFTSESENRTERARDYFESEYDVWTRENLKGEEYNVYHILTTRVIELDKIYHPFSMNIEDLRKYKGLIEGHLM